MEGLAEKIVDNVQGALDFVRHGRKSLIVAETNMVHISSR